MTWENFISGILIGVTLYTLLDIVIFLFFGVGITCLLKNIRNKTWKQFRSKPGDLFVITVTNINIGQKFLPSIYFVVEVVENFKSTRKLKLTTPSYFENYIYSLYSSDQCNALEKEGLRIQIGLVKLLISRLEYEKVGFVGVENMYTKDEIETIKLLYYGEEF